MLRDRIKYALRPLMAKPWNNPVMEYRYGLWMGVSALFSESGRQLGEENTRPFALNHHIPAETHACKYAGSRHGRLINMSALRIAMRNFDAALDITRAVGEYHYAHLSLSGCIGQKNSEPEALGIWDLYLLSRASIAIIAYQLRYRSGTKASETVPDDLASQYQFISGIFMICRDMLERAGPSIATNNILGAQQLYDYADEQGIFISFNDMACAGSVKKIKEFLEFCVNIKAPAENPDNQRVSMGDLVANPGNWYLYALSTVELDCFIEAEAARRKSQRQPGHAETLKKSLTSYEAVGRYCRDLMWQAEGGDTGTDVDINANAQEAFETGILRRQNEILSLLQRPPVMRLSQKHLDARLGL